MTLKIYLLGQFRLQANDLPVELPSRPAQSAMAYLALNAGVTQRREKLSSLLWPEASEANARAYLRQALWRIRKSFQKASLIWEDYLKISDISVNFRRQCDYWLDAEQLLYPLETSSVEQIVEIVELYNGELLPGFYDEWVVLERDRLGTAYHQKMNLLLDRLIKDGRWDKVLHWGEKWIQLGHAPEPAYRALMKAHAGLGDQVMVSDTYQRCRQILASEMGLEPSPETRLLYEQILLGEPESYQGPTAPSVQISIRKPLFLVEGNALQVEPAPFVARENELVQLEEHLERALANQGRVVFVTGEAGSGKTALINTFCRRAQENHEDLVVVTGNCNAYTGFGDPYLPFREALEMLSGDVESRWAAGAISTGHARRVWENLPATARGLVEHGPDLVGTFVAGPALIRRVKTCIPGEQNLLTNLEKFAGRHAETAVPLRSLQEDLNEQYSRVLGYIASEKPLLILLDDLQWVDPGSVSLLFHLGRVLAGRRILIVGAYRPEEVALVRDGERHPLVQVLNELQRLFGDISISLDNIEGNDFVERLLECEPNDLTTGFQALLQRQTQGHPLFTIELLRGMQERGDLIKDQDGKWIEGPALDWESMPARVEAVIAERVGRLEQPLQDILRVASVEGETFTAEVAAQVLGFDQREVVQHLGTELERTHNLVQVHAIRALGSRQMSRYRFKHYLCQKYVYDSMDEVERTYLHKDVGAALESFYSTEEQDLPAFAPQLARHFQQARVSEKAVHYLYLSGKKAVQLSAYQEALLHLDHGLELLLTLPDSPWRAEQELDLQITIGMAWMGIEGTISPRLETAYTRARDLCLELGDNYNLCRVLHELGTIHFVRAEPNKAYKIAEELLDHANSTGDPMMVSLGNWLFGIILFDLGEYAASHEHLRKVIDKYHPDQHQEFLILRGCDGGVSSMGYDTCNLWCLGYPDQAQDYGQHAIALARELGHPFSLADVLCYAGCEFSLIRLDAKMLQYHAEELEQLSIEKGLFWRGLATWFQAQVPGMMGNYEQGIERMRQSLAEMRSIRDYSSTLGTLAALASALVGSGQPEVGLETLAEAFDFVEKTGLGHWVAELYRLQGEIFITLGDEAGGEISLNNAISTARKQSARSWELRAATDLANLMKNQGRIEEAKTLLGGIYGWFTEGFDTPDLIRAKTLLDELG